MSTITIHGNLATDPELRYLPNGTPVVELVVLENRRRKNDNGDWEDLEPNRFNVKAWRSLAENVANSVIKGHRVTVEGTIKTDRWEDRETNEPRTRQYIDADEVSISLRYHTAQPVPATAPANN